MPASTFMPEIEVSIAFPDGFTTPAASRTWTDVTTYVEAKQITQVMRGRGDQFSTVQPSRLTLTLDNRDGRFTPEYASGAYYPNVKRGRPVRVRARWPITTGTWYDLFVGYVHEWPVAWPDGTDAYSSVTVTAMSRFARLANTAEFRSIVEEEVLYDDPVLYYPLGEPAGATEAGNIAGVSRPERLIVTQIGSGGTLEFGAGIGPGTDDLTAPVFTPVNSSNGKYLVATLINETIPVGNKVIEADCQFSSTVTPSGYSPYLIWWQATTEASGLEGLLLAISGGGGGQLIALMYASGGVIAVSASGAGSVCDGAIHHGVARATLDAATNKVTVSLIVDGVTTTSAAVAWPYGTAGSPVFLQPTNLRVGGAPAGQLHTGTISHVGVYTEASTAITDARFTAHFNAGNNGFTADASGARVARYARLAGIPTAEISTETGLTTSVAHSDTTGQSPTEMMQKVATTEDGLVFDGRDGTLTFHSRSHRYGATSAFTLSCTAGEVEADLSPVLDDQGMTNDMTASRANGVTVRSVNQASIDEHGYYRDNVELMTTSDNEVQSRADWQVNRFGTPRVKLTSITVDLINSSSAQITALLAADIGTRFTVSNLPSQAPASSMQFFIEGIAYNIWPESSGSPFTVTFNTSAAAYADVWTLDSSTLSQLDSTTVLAF